MREAAPVLRAQGLYKSYGAIRVLQNVDISVATGSRHAVIGPNGAGKTTLFKVLSGELFSDQGSVEFEGRDVSRRHGFQRVRDGMGRTFQVARVFAEESVQNNMLLALQSHKAGQTFGLRDALSVSIGRDLLEECHAMLDKVGLARRLHDQAGVLAYGERKRLELAMTLALKPRMLLLDEPMAGMSPGDRTGAIQLLNQISEETGISILLTEHDMNVVFSLADHVTVLNYGEVIASGTPEEVKASPLVREVYLGQ
ncbi:ABC transporter ATP-binding protein [bacterium SGD-2]|nr:ABC transporter ATP-binding protein [bacterium SGD-2]